MNGDSGPKKPAATEIAARPTFGIGDVWGGIASMLVAFPSAIAFGVVIFTAVSPSLAGAGAIAGIVGAAALGIVAPLAGRNPGFITAPCAPAAAVMSGLAAELSQAGTPSPVRILALLSLAAITAGALQIALGALRFGGVIKFIPYQVVTGYLSGVAVIIFAAQIPKLLGTPGSMHLSEAVIALPQWQWPGIIVGIVTIATMSLTMRYVKIVPGSITGLLAGLAAYFALAAFHPAMRHLEGNSLVIGPIRTTGSLLDTLRHTISLRSGSLMRVQPADLLLVIGPALTLAVLLSVDTLKTGVVLDAMTRSRHDSNRELIGQGVANVASFFAGGVPGSAAMGPSLLNATSGGRTVWSGVIEGSLVLTGFLLLGRWMAWLPTAALAGILLVVAFRMFDFKMFRLLFLPGARLDFMVIAAVIIVAETVGLIQASLTGVSLAILLFIRNQVRGSVILRKADLTQIRSKRVRTSEERDLLHAHGADALFVQLRGDLFFGTTDQLFVDLEHDLAQRRFILFDLRRVESMDYTAAHLLIQMQERLHERGGQLLFSGMPSTIPSQPDINDYLRRLGVVPKGSASVFEMQDGALEWMEDRILEAAGWVPAAHRPPLTLEEIALFAGIDAESLRELEPAVGTRSVQQGERVFSVGDAGNEIFFVRSGRVHILLPLPGGKQHHLATMCRADFFGEMSFLDLDPRSANAEAASSTELFVMPRAVFDGIATKNVTLAAQVFEQLAIAMSHRLRVADAEILPLEQR
ncbi:MAG TPA: SulP family inorganic anion transporter [Thermoanaerobaculia bacterium]|nr:SulP family inorganic anion transporter [Thermoanaerobaculia bacterium]